MRTKRVLIGLAAIIAASTGSVVAAPTASAAALHGCPDANFCFYFNSDFAGGRADFLLSDGDLDDEVFNKGGTNGRGLPVKNNAASVSNNWKYYATVYFNSGCNGSIASQTFGAFSAANFNATMKNQNASFKWPASPLTGDKDCANRDQS